MITRTPIPAREPCIRAELDHAEGNDSARERVAVSGGTDEGIDVMCEIALRRDVQRKQEKQANDMDKSHDPQGCRFYSDLIYIYPRKICGLTLRYENFGAILRSSVPDTRPKSRSIPGSYVLPPMSRLVVYVSHL